MKERDKKGKARTGREYSRETNSFLTTAGSVGWEKSLSDRAAIPSLQTQSAESRMTFTETKMTTSQLRSHLHSLRAYRLSLLQTHSSFQAMHLTHEHETITLKTTSSPNKPRRAEELDAAVASYGRKIGEMRRKQRREVELYKRSKEEQVEGWESGNGELKARVRRFEEKLREIENRDKESDEKYTQQLAEAQNYKAQIEGELRRLREERVRDLRHMFALQRKSLAVSTPLPLSLHRQKSEGSQQTAKELLAMLKRHLSAASSGALKRPIFSLRRF